MRSESLLMAHDDQPDEGPQRGTRTGVFDDSETFGEDLEQAPPPALSSPSRRAGPPFIVPNQRIAAIIGTQP